VPGLPGLFSGRILRGMRRALQAFTPLLALVLSPAAAACAQDAPPRAAPLPMLTVTRDVELQPEITYGGLVIAASGVTVDGRGARIVGPVQHAAELSGATARTSAFTGTGVQAAGVDDVTLRGLRVRGFEIGLLLQDARGWTIEDCDVSDNFHDPDFGWGEQGSRGGLVLRRVGGSTLRRVRANRNWDGCSLADSDDNSILACDFSHCSNTCLKLWHAARNLVQDCDLSWGLRIAPGEVHARDSTCVLLESGSDGNRFVRNDATHGGDGIFIRVLNGWTSRGNLFDGNDASWANNNGFEAWSPGNTYTGNVASHCSYGFWLGASDETVLRDNEAGWNGDPQGFHNAPESFGHGGIVFVNGPSSHTLVEGNRLHHNAGGGLVLRGDEASAGAAWKAFHWVIQDNALQANRWGIWMGHADFIELGPNSYAENAEGDVHDAGGVTGLLRRSGDGRPPPPADRRLSVALEALAGPHAAGSTVEFVASSLRSCGDPGALRFRWSFGDGGVAEGPVVQHLFARPGFYRVGLLAHDPECVSSALSRGLVYVVDSDELPATEKAAALWRLPPDSASIASFDVEPGLLGRAVHARVEPYDGGRVELLWPASRDAGLALAGHARLAFWIRARDPHIPAWQDTNPVITLLEGEGRWLRLTPARDWLGNPPDTHFRDDWMPLDVPLAGGDGWTRELGPDGAPARVQWLTIGVDSWGAPPLDVWLDGLSLR